VTPWSRRTPIRTPPPRRRPFAPGTRPTPAPPSRLLRHVPGATPATDARGEPKLSPIVTALRKAGDQIESPMPTWRGLRDHEQEQERRRLLRLQRSRRRIPPSTEAEAA